MKTTKLALSLYALALMVCTFTVAQDEAAPRATLTAPKIVASGVFQHQSAAIAPMTILTPSTAGLYRISVYISMTNQQPNVGWFAHILIIDASSDVEMQVGAISPGNNFGSGIFSPRPGIPINFQVEPSGVPSVGFYTARYVIEQIQ
jgi:hypothetical protein